MPEYSFELIGCKDKLNIPFDKPYDDVQVSIELWFNINPDVNLDSDDIGNILEVCKYDILEAIGKSIEKKVDEIRGNI